MEHLTHTIPPTYDEHSRVLVLGSFPSPKSRSYGFNYGHPQNRFWRVLAELAGEELPASVEDRRAFCLRHGIALWDVVAECDIQGASDASIKNAAAEEELVAGLVHPNGLVRGRRSVRIQDFQARGCFPVIQVLHGGTSLFFARQRCRKWIHRSFCRHHKGWGINWQYRLGNRSKNGDPAQKMAGSPSKNGQYRGLLPDKLNHRAAPDFAESEKSGRGERKRMDREKRNAAERVRARFRFCACFWLPWHSASAGC